MPKSNQLRGGSHRGKTTTDHDKIRKWAESRGGHPATVKTRSRDKAGVLRIDFPGYRGKESLEEISWDDFFDKFDREKLAFLYQDKTAGGKTSRFSKFVQQEEASGQGASQRRGRSKAAASKTSSRGGAKRSTAAGRTSGKSRASAKARGGAGGKGRAKTARSKG